MKTLFIDHPESAVRKALIQTLKYILPEAVFSEDVPSATADGIVFTPAATPQPFKALVADLIRQAEQQKRPTLLDIPPYRVDVRAREFSGPAMAPVMLTEKEIDVLAYLYQRKIPATRDDLLRDVWQYAADVDTHTIETHIYRLRQKIEPDAEEPTVLITTKDGYQLAAFSKA